MLHVQQGVSRVTGHRVRPLRAEIIKVETNKVLDKMAFIPAWSRAALDISTVLRLARAKGNIRSLGRPEPHNGACTNLSYEMEEAMTQKGKLAGQRIWDERETINADSVEPEDILEGHDPASRLRISIVRGEEVLYQGVLPWGEVQIIVEELY